MTAQAVANPFPPFLSGGQPLSSGKIYLGQANQDPRTFPVSVYWDQALTIAAQQPLRTSGGYIYRNNAPAIPYVDGEFSILVLDENDRQVFYLASAGTDLVVSAFWETVLAETTAAGSRTALDVRYTGDQAAVTDYSLAPVINSGALTISTRNRDGTTPSASRPLTIAYRSATPSVAELSVSEFSSSDSVVISSGSTLGVAANTPFRLWIVSIKPAAANAQLAVVNCLDSNNNIFGLREDKLYTVTADGGAGGADSAHVLYGTAAVVAASPIRILGYMEWTAGLAVPGTWVAPDKVQLFTPGMPLPGEVIQRAGNTTGAVATGTTQMPFDDTIPQITEGDQYMTQAITPASGANVLEIDVQAQLTNSAANGQIMSLFQDATANALAAIVENVTVNELTCLTLGHVMRAGTTSATTFRMRSGGNAAGTTTFNGSGGSRRFGGVANSFMKVQEIMA
jgi:hypothetical protein